MQQPLTFCLTKRFFILVFSTFIFLEVIIC